MMQHLRRARQLKLSAQQHRCTAYSPHLTQQPKQQRHLKSITHAVPPIQQDPDLSGSNEPTSSSSRRQQSSQTPPVKDKPDMGPRARRSGKIPFPQLPDTSQPGSFESPTDADSPGFQERALLAGFLETLDPKTRQQFAQYMESQLQQLQQSQEQQQRQSSAADFLQAAIETGAYRSMRSPADLRSFFNSRKADAVMWDTLRDQFTRQEVALLDEVLGRDWSSFNSRALNPDTVQRISNLTVEQQAVLSNVLSKISNMTQQMDAMEADVQSAAENNSVSNSADHSGAKSKSSWGASFRRRKVERVGSYRKSRGPASQAAAAAAATAAAAAAAAASGASPEQHWDTLLDSGMSDKVQRMMALAGAASRGQLQWGRPPSRHFVQLQRICTQMVQLETQQQQQQQPGQLSGADVAAAYASINRQLNELVAQGDSIQDNATRSALLYMDALFNSSSSDSDGSSSSSKTARADSSGLEAAAAVGEVNNNNISSSSSSTDKAKQQRQQQEGDARPAATGMVSLGKLQKLDKFLKAAASLEAYQTLLSVIAEKHPNLASEEMMWFSNLGGDDWFVKPELQDQALAAAQAAAEAFAAVEAAAARAPHSSSSSSRGSISSAISGALLPYIDESRIEALAVLDADTLWFMAELEANNNSEDVIMKWSLHPSVGQKMLSGSWLAESSMPEQLRQLYEKVKAPDFMSVLNLDLNQQ